MLRIFLLTLLLAAPLCAQTYVDLLSYGGIGTDTAYGVAIDDQGNSYACGSFDGTLDVQPGAASFDITGFYAGFIAKYDAARSVQWAQVLEPVNPGDWVIPEMPAVDAAGNVYIVGRFFGSVDFDPSAGQAIESATDAQNNPINCCAFLLKFDAAGSFQWVRTLEGDYSWGVRIDVTDTLVCATGLYQGTLDLDPGVGTLDATAGAGLDSFILMLDSDGELVWADAYASSALGLMSAPAIQANGDVIAAVSYVQDITLGQATSAPSFSCAGNVDMLLMRYDAAGALSWVKEVQGTGCNVTVSGLAQDGQGFVYLTGSMRGDPDFDPGAGTQTAGVAVGNNSFIAKYSSAGDLVWARGLYSYQDVSTFACACDEAGVVVAGSLLTAADLDPGAGYATHYLTDGGAFALRLDIDGNYAWSISFGSVTTGTGASNNTQATTQVYGMASNGAGDLLLCGPFEDSGDFNPGSGIETATAVAGRDGWVLWLDDAQASQVPPLQILEASIAMTVEGDFLSVTLTAANGSGTGYQWTLDQGYLPPGVTGLPGNGTPSITLSGTTLASGMYNFRVRVTDDANETATRNFSWVIASKGGAAPEPTDPRNNAGGGGCVAAAGGTAWLGLVALLIPLALRRRKRA